MKEIPLTKGQVALVDDEDYDYLIKKKWHTTNNNHDYLYAGWDKRNKDGVHCNLMHRVITNCPEGMFVDHIDHNGLNNQKSNLRICTRSENSRNKTASGRSKYLGVYFQIYKHPIGRTYTYIKAVIKKGETYYRLGSFKTEEDAARAYDIKALELFKEFANTNFSREWYQSV